MKEQDIIIIGGGVAGLWSALTLAEKGRNVLVVRKGRGSATALSSGSIDIGAPIVSDNNPFTHLTLDTRKNLEHILSANPHHPMHLFLKDDDIDTLLRTSGEIFNKFVEELKGVGLSYNGAVDRCCPLINTYGTLKVTNLAPTSQYIGNLIELADSKVLLLGINGLPFFDSCSASRTIPYLSGLFNIDIGDIRYDDIDLPGLDKGYDLSPFQAARRLNEIDIAEKLADRLKDLFGGMDITHIGLPPVLGIEGHQPIFDVVTGNSGFKVFEYNSSYPSVPGLRLATSLEQAVLNKGAEIISGRVTEMSSSEGHILSINVELDNKESNELSASSYIIATGKYITGGIIRKQEIIEPIFHLEVFCKGNALRRLYWEDGVDLDLLRSQPLFSCGLRVDKYMRPLNSKGAPHYKNLRAAGSILGGYDHIREGTRMGMAILSAHKAAEMIDD